MDHGWTEEGGGPRVNGGERWTTGGRRREVDHGWTEEGGGPWVDGDLNNIAHWNKK